jgi:hypothetical protein
MFCLCVPLQVFLGRPFWRFATPLVHAHFPHTKDCTPEEFYRAVNQVHLLNSCC